MKERSYIFLDAIRQTRSTPVAAVPSPAAPLNVSSELVNSSTISVCLCASLSHEATSQTFCEEPACPSQRRRPPLPASYPTRLRSRLPAAASRQLSVSPAGRRFQTAIRLASGRACLPPLPGSYPTRLRSRLPAAASRQLSESPPVAPAGRRFQHAIRTARLMRAHASPRRRPAARTLSESPVSPRPAAARRPGCTRGSARLVADRARRRRACRRQASRYPNPAPLGPPPFRPARLGHGPSASRPAHPLT